MVATMSSSPLPHALTSIAPPPDLSPTSVAAAAAAGADATSSGGSSSAALGGGAAAAPTPGDHSRHHHPQQHHPHDHGASSYVPVNGAMHQPPHGGAVPVAAVMHGDAPHHAAPLPEAQPSSSMMTSSGVNMTMYSTPPPGMPAAQSPPAHSSDPNSPSPVTYDYQAYQQAPAAHTHTHAPGSSVAFAPGMYDPTYSTASASYPSHTPMASHTSHLPPVPPEAQTQSVSIAVPGTHSRMSLAASSGAAADGTASAELHRHHHRNDVEMTGAAPPEGGGTAELSLSSEVALVLQGRRDPNSSAPLDHDFSSLSSKLSKASRGELLDVLQHFDTEVLRAACRQHMLGESPPSANSSPSAASSDALVGDSRMSSSSASAAAASGGVATPQFASFHPTAAATAANDGSTDPYGTGGDPTAAAAAGAASLPPPPPPPMSESQTPADPSSDNSLPTGVWYNSVGRFVCRQCNKDFASLSRVNAHLKVHSNNKPHACPQCDRRFARKHHMRDHVLTVHQNYKPFECPHCFRSFGKRSTLIRHIATHTESKIPCPVKACPRTFRDQKTMQNHLSTHRMPHPAAAGSPGGPGGGGASPSGMTAPAAAVPFHAPMDMNGYAPSPTTAAGGNGGDAHRHTQHNAHHHQPPQQQQHHPPAPPAAAGGNGSGGGPLPLVPGSFVPMPGASGSGPPSNDGSAHHQQHHQQQQQQHAAAAAPEMKHFAPPRSPYEQFSHAGASPVHTQHHEHQAP